MTKVRFLVLEDDAIELQRIQSALTQGDIDGEFVPVQTREAFVAALETQAFNLVLANYQLAEFSALAALEILQAQNLDVPLILVTEPLGEETAIAALKQGVTDYVLKQRLERLVPAVDRALREVQERRNRYLAEAELQLAYADLEMRSTELEAANTELQETLENLQIFEEEVRQQNEELITARRTAEEQWQRYQDLFNFAPDGYVVTGASGLIQTVNQAFLRLLDADEPDCIGRTLMYCLASDDRAFFIDQLNLLRRSRTDAQQPMYELKLQPRRGEAFPVAITVTAMRTEGELIGFRWLIRDIRVAKRLEAERLRNEIERKQAEIALREANANLQTLIDAAPLPIVEIEPDCTVRLWNPAAARVFGWRAEEAIGRPLPIVSEEKLGECLTVRNAVVRGESFWGVETYRLKRDGSPIDVMISAAPLHSQSGEVTSMLLMFNDVTEQKRVQDALRQSESKFRMIVESAKDFAIITLDLDGRITSWNAGAQRILQYEESEIVGQTDHVIFTPEDQADQAPEQEVNEALTTGRALNERWHVRKDGSQFWGSGLVMPLLDEAGEIEGFLKIMQDKTEQRQTQEALKLAALALDRANRIKDEFLAVLSHELRTPMNPILGWTKLLKSGRCDPPKARQAIEIIERNAELQIQLIEDLLDVSRILSGKFTLNANVIDLCTVVSAAIDTVNLAATAKGIDIQMQLPSRVLQARGDAGRLQQVVWNLLSNAVKFTPNNGRVEVRVQRIDDRACIQITDTGKGIIPEFLPHVFEYFRQEDSSTTRKFGGLGLGLAIVRQIVELHGGTVSVQSPGEGQGATFTVKLPLIEVTEQPSQSTSRESNSLPDLPLSGIRAIVVDDEVDSRDFVAFALAQDGAEVKTASSGIAAIDLLASFNPDVLISDIGMPHLDGYELVQKIRKMPGGQEIIAIALTAYASETDQKKAIASGFQQHLSKPINPDQLLATVIELSRRS